MLKQVHNLGSLIDLLITIIVFWSFIDNTTVHQQGRYYPTFRKILIIFVNQSIMLWGSDSKPYYAITLFKSQQIIMSKQT